MKSFPMRKLLLICAVVLFSCEKDEIKCYECIVYENGIESQSFRITNPTDDFMYRCSLPIIEGESVFTTKCREIVFID